MWNFNVTKITDFFATKSETDCDKTQTITKKKNKCIWNSTSLPLGNSILKQHLSSKFRQHTGKPQEVPSGNSGKGRWGIQNFSNLRGGIQLCC